MGRKNRCRAMVSARLRQFLILAPVAKLDFVEVAFVTCDLLRRVEELHRATMPELTAVYFGLLVFNVPVRT